MRKYFIVENNQQAGPFSIDELRVKEVGPSTLAWFEGLPNWQQAATINELNELFVSPPPLYHEGVPSFRREPASSYHPMPVQENTGGNMIAIAYLLALLGGIGGIVAGAILWMGNQKADGKKHKRYTATGQLHGAFAFFLGIIVWAVCVEMFLK
ncbi:MAG: DUF4339 domain-containing protein [Prolixibacteraceae bacterium]|nr:DUF4339 domain-containing protein [Prolixibacteraceae bacterium]